MAAQKPVKETVYRRIRVSGLLTLIPIALCVGPLAGFAAGEWLRDTFSLPHWVPAACAACGFLGGVLETVRVIKVALRSVEKR